jgi:hypothetical protein
LHPHAPADCHLGKLLEQEIAALKTNALYG